MDDLRGFIEAGFWAVRESLAEARARAGLHLEPETISRARARRFLSQIRAIETVVRRLIFLLAASVQLAPPRGKASAATVRPEPSSVPAKRQPCFRLLSNATFDPEALAALPARSGYHQREQTPGAPLLHRYHTLLTLLKDPDRAARRMARLLRRMKSAGEPRPLVLPQEHTHRMRAELGLIATALPDLAAEALSGWYDTS